MVFEVKVSLVLVGDGMLVANQENEMAMPDSSCVADKMATRSLSAALGLCRSGFGRRTERLLGKSMAERDVVLDVPMKNAH